ncbi:MAG: DUF262 domain-containing protein [Leptospirales bacterium]|nr:DUF262 domain-containing protein [Leptospirales bacterium]
MKAEEKPITEIITDAKIYEIPRYQRPYAWDEENAMALLQDTWDAFKDSPNREYFIGALITIEKQPNERFEIVDGQQRLTTLTLIFTALRNLLPTESQKTELQKRLMPKNVFTGAAESPRLIVRNQDRAFFQEYILRSDPQEPPLEISESQRRLHNNMRRIQTWLHDGERNPHLGLYTNFLLTMVYAVFVKANDFTSAYRLFNVLNARGKPLSNGDLLKNKLFDLCANDATELDLVEDYWSDIEDLIPTDRLDNFLSHYRTSEKAAKTDRNLFEEYSALLEKATDSASQFALRLKTQAEHYASLLDPDHKNLTTRKAFVALSRVPHDDWLPPALAFLRSNSADSDLQIFAQLLENVTYTMWILGYSRARRNTHYYTIVDSVKKGVPLRDIATTLAKTFPSSLLRDALNSDVYGQSYAMPILLRLEEEAQDGSVIKTFAARNTIEHILPQTITDSYWTSRFTKEQHKQWVHRIGNLTLLSGKKNSGVSNSPFPAKVIYYNKKLGKVAFDLTKEVTELQDWTVQEAEKRQKSLIDRAITHWSLEAGA